jgi:hypothetical protein
MKNIESKAAKKINTKNLVKALNVSSNVRAGLSLPIGGPPPECLICGMGAPNPSPILKA